MSCSHEEGRKVHERDSLIQLTAKIVQAHVSRNRVGFSDVAALIATVHDGLAAAHGRKEEGAIAAPLVPAVPIRASVKPEFLVCLTCGFKAKTLRRHLMSAHGQNPETYRAHWGLPTNYPMMAQNYRDVRSALSKRSSGSALEEADAPTLPEGSARPRAARPVAQPVDGEERSDEIRR